MDVKQLHQLFSAYPRVCTDTRKITPNCLFFALKGPNFNGNAFASEALKKGAAQTIIDEARHNAPKGCILVDDVLDTLQKLSTYHRNHCNAKIIALTGSNGKTTTKELIYAVLSKKYRTISTQGNLNNHIGVPLTLLSIKPDTEIAIVEMGANHKREIAFLSALAGPDFGYITNFGKAHLQGFGGIEGVIQGKSELYEHLIANNADVFFNADDPVQVRKLGNYPRKIGFSAKSGKYHTIKFVKADPMVVLETGGTRISTKLIGAYNFTNCCAAVLMGKYFNVATKDIKTAIEAYSPQNNRSQVLVKNGKKVVLDAYNANPSSMRAALENLKVMNLTDPVLVLGDMFELGESAAMEHQAMADLAKNLEFGNVFLVGENFYKTETSFQKFQSFDSLRQHLLKEPINGGSVFIKGSRGMALERLMEYV